MLFIYVLRGTIALHAMNTHLSFFTIMRACRLCRKKSCHPYVAAAQEMQKNPFHVLQFLCYQQFNNTKKMFADLLALIVHVSFCKCNRKKCVRINRDSWPSIKIIEKLSYWQRCTDLLDRVIAGEREHWSGRIGMRKAAHDKDWVM